MVRAAGRHEHHDTQPEMTNSGAKLRRPVHAFYRLRHLSTKMISFISQGHVMLGGKMRVRLALFLAVMLCASLLGAISAATLSSSAAAASCATYEFIGARGSGEDPTPDYTQGAPGGDFGMGSEIFNVYDQVAKLVGPANISPYGVHYPAVSFGQGWDVPADLNGLGAFLGIGPLGAYTASVKQGTADVENQINSAHAACPSTMFVLAGYSQGAQAVGDALQRMSSADLALVAGAVLFGDPYFDADSWAARGSFKANRYGVLGIRSEYPASMQGKIFSYCHARDPICQLEEKFSTFFGTFFARNPFGEDVPGFAAHKDYVAAGDTGLAAQDLAQLLNLPPSSSGAPLDVAFAIDSTGSMGAAIASVQENVDEIASDLSSSDGNVRFALVDYKDDPADDSPYQAEVDTGFTTDLGQFTNAVNGLFASGGGDFPESVYDGVITALGLPWRQGVAKAVVDIGDAPGKDPEPVTGYTLADVASASQAVGAIDGISAAVDTVPIFDADQGSYDATLASFQAIADATGGQVFPDDLFASAGVVKAGTTPNGSQTSPSGSSNGSATGSARSAAPSSKRATPADSPSDPLVAAIEAALTAARTAPSANAGGPYEGIAGAPVQLSGGASTDVSEPIASWSWDFDNSGSFTPFDTPTASHTYSEPGTYTVGLRVAGASGATAVSETTVTVDPPPTAAPGTPTGLTATPGVGEITLNWMAAPGTPADFFNIVDPKGNVVDSVAANSDGSAPPDELDNLTNGVAYTLSVVAVNVAGASQPSAAVTATPNSVAVTGLTANPAGSVSFGQPVTFTAIVSGPSPAPAVPTGQVTFLVDGFAVATVALDSHEEAAVTTRALTPGAHVIAAHYLGDANFAGSTATLGGYGTTCVSTITGAHIGAVATSGASTCVVNASVHGSITAARGTAVAVIGSIVTGSIDSASAQQLVEICNATVGGATVVSGAQALVIVGDPGDANCPVNSIKGTLALQNNTDGVVAIGNTVGGLVDSRDTGPGPYPGDVTTIAGNISVG